MSRRNRERAINLVYKLASALDSECRIRRDPLHRQFSVNCGVEIYCETEAGAERLLNAMLAALKKRGAQDVTTKRDRLVGPRLVLPGRTASLSFGEVRLSEHRIRCGGWYGFEVYPHEERR